MKGLKGEERSFVADLKDKQYRNNNRADCLYSETSEDILDPT